MLSGWRYSRKVGPGRSIRHLFNCLYRGMGRRRGRNPMSSIAAEPRDVSRESDLFSPIRELMPLPPAWRSLPAALVHSVRSHPSKVALADSTGASLTYGDTLVRALALGRVLSRTWGDSRHVGLMIPPTVPAVVANLAVSLWGKIPVNLNYTRKSEGG